MNVNVKEIGFNSIIYGNTASLHQSCNGEQVIIRSCFAGTFFAGIIKYDN